MRQTQTNFKSNSCIIFTIATHLFLITKCVQTKQQDWEKRLVRNWKNILQAESYSYLIIIVSWEIIGKGQSFSGSGEMLGVQERYRHVVWISLSRSIFQNGGHFRNQPALVPFNSCNSIGLASRIEPSKTRSLSWQKANVEEGGFLHANFLDRFQRQDQMVRLRARIMGSQKRFCWNASRMALREASRALDYWKRIWVDAKKWNWRIVSLWKQPLAHGGRNLILP